MGEGEEEERESGKERAHENYRMKGSRQENSETRGERRLRRLRRRAFGVVVDRQGSRVRESRGNSASPFQRLRRRVQRGFLSSPSLFFNIHISSSPVPNSPPILPSPLVLAQKSPDIPWYRDLYKALSASWYKSPQTYGVQ